MNFSNIITDLKIKILGSLDDPTISLVCKEWKRINKLIGEALANSTKPSVADLWKAVRFGSNTALIKLGRHYAAIKVRNFLISSDQQNPESRGTLKNLLLMLPRVVADPRQPDANKSEAIDIAVSSFTRSTVASVYSLYKMKKFGSLEAGKKLSLLLYLRYENESVRFTFETESFEMQFDQVLEESICLGSS